ncbi:hypothetical protein ZWY2020_037157 [Hordeum vulgare]|nr:hypothetical protein ZWY2020_037157 [Hordeum vulgare]
MSLAWHMNSLTQLLLALAWGDGAGHRRPSPCTRPRTTVPWMTWRTMSRSLPPPRPPGRVPRGRRSSSLKAPTCARPLTTKYMAGGSGVEEPCDDLDACSVDHNHCIHKKGTKPIIHPPFKNQKQPCYHEQPIHHIAFFGFKWAIIEHFYHYRRSQAHGSHYDHVHPRAMMTVREDVSRRSNHINNLL